MPCLQLINLLYSELEATNKTIFDKREHQFVLFNSFITFDQFELSYCVNDGNFQCLKSIPHSFK